MSEQRFFTNLTAYDDGEGTPSEVWSFTYDAFGRQVEVVRTGATGSASVFTSYDARGQVTRIESPEGIISYAYDLFGRRTKTMIGEANAPTSETQYRGVAQLGASPSWAAQPQEVVNEPFNCR